MDDEKIFHDWLVEHLRARFSRQYTSVRVNRADAVGGAHDDAVGRTHYQGCYPDIILENHGMVIGIVEVETEGTVCAEKAEVWKKEAALGVKLVIMVPEKSRARLTTLLWDAGIAANVAVGSYELRISMP
jgi:hypothetical protein